MAELDGDSLTCSSTMAAAMRLSISCLNYANKDPWSSGAEASQELWPDGRGLASGIRCSAWRNHHFHGRRTCSMILAETPAFIAKLNEGYDIVSVCFFERRDG